MAGAQIATSVTILNSLKGFIGLSLTDILASSESQIAAGSVVEVAGAFFQFPSDESINATSWSAIASGQIGYIALTPSGTAGSQIVSAAYISGPPVWNSSNQGWYASAISNIRVVGGVYKNSATSYTKKFVMSGNLSQSFFIYVEV